MTTKQTEAISTTRALKLALEALESCSVGDYSTGHVIHPSFDVDAVNKAIDAVDEALMSVPDGAQSRSDVEQPAPVAEPHKQQQEPVAWSPRLDYSGYADKRVWANGKPKQEDIEYWSKNGGGVDVAYTSPQPAPVAEPHKQPEPCQCPECQVTPHASDCAVHNEPAYPNGACNCRAQPVQDYLAGVPPMLPQMRDGETIVVSEQEPVAYDKTELNCFAQDLYDKKMREGKHGHYESMFHVIHQCIKKVAPPANKPLTDEEIDNLPWGPHEGNPMTFAEGLRDFARAIEAKLKEKNA